MFARTRLNFYVTRNTLRYITSPVQLAYTPLKPFSSEFYSFPIKNYAFLTTLLVKILFRCWVSTLGLCPQMSVIRVGSL